MLHIFKFLLFNFYKSNQGLILVYILFNLLLYPLNSIYLPKLYSELINKVSIKKKCRKDINTETENSFEFLNFIDNFKNKDIPHLIYFIAFVSILVGIFFRLKRYIYCIIFPKYKMWIRNELFSKTLEKKKLDFEEQKVGKEIMKIEYLIYTLREIFNVLIVNMVELLLMAVLIMGYLYFKNKNIALLVFSELIIIGLLIYLSYNKIKESALKKVESYYYIADNIDNSFNNLSNILINNQIDNEVKKNDKISDNYKKNDQKSMNILNNLSFGIRIVTVITLVIILVISYRLTLKNKISGMNFTIIVIVLLHFQNYLYNQVWDISLLLDRLVQVKYHEDYLTDLLMPNYNSKNLKNVINKGKIEFKNVTFKYKKTNKYILKDLNFKIEPNEKIAILGKSGSGKSTLVKLLIRFFKLNGGSIEIDDIKNTDINVDYLRKNINYINQNTLLFDKDIYYNISYGNRNLLNEEKKSKKIIDDLLNKYDLLSIFNNLDNGLNTIAGPRGSKLSIGMQKITILMRGLMRNSKIIIFDEPLTGLDENSRKKVINLIMGETKNKTSIIITHDKEIIPYMDRDINLKDINNV